MIHTRYNAGAVSRLDVLLAERSLASQKASYEKLLQSRSETVHALAIILDIEPSAYSDKLPDRFPLEELSNIQANIPADRLSNRPDMHAAGMRLEESGLGIDVAKASFYPSFNLTGSIGTGSNALVEILHNPIGTLALNIALPFLNWNENSINLKISKVAYEQAKVEFRQKALQCPRRSRRCIVGKRTICYRGQRVKTSLFASQRSREALWDKVSCRSFKSQRVARCRRNSQKCTVVIC